MYRESMQNMGLLIIIGRHHRLVLVVLSILLLHLIISHANSAQSDAPGCALDFSGYTPVGACISRTDDVDVGVVPKVKAWDSVETTRCCLNALDTLSQAMAAGRANASSLFPTREEWAACNLTFHPQRGVSISSCGFGDFYEGSTRCSSQLGSLAAITRSLSHHYTAAVWNCSLLIQAPDFDDKCAGCLDGIAGMREAIVKQLKVAENDHTEVAACGVAVVAAVAASEMFIRDSSSVRYLYACLSALNTEGQESSSPKYNAPKYILATVAAAMGLILVILLIKYVNRMPQKPIEGKVFSTWSGLYRFSKAEIEKAINHGDQRVSLGSGSAGRVYRGVLPSGQLVAIKHIYKTSTADSFGREVEELSRIRHPNIVSLFGCCIEADERYLVYEYCSTGNLAQSLLRKDNVLPWHKRVKILRDCALALRFLHNHPDGCTVHRDIKLTNILLTEDMEPKLSDFGLAKMIGFDETKVFSEVRGTIGYMDPEYMTNAQLTCASDIYSFGIVILQLLSGRKVIELDIDARDILTKKAKDVAQRKRPLEDFVDHRLEKDVNLTDFNSILQIAVLCVASSSQGRPSSEDLYYELDRIWTNTLANMPPRARKSFSTMESFEV